MTRHVTDESLPDLVEGGGSEAERAHVRACGPCTARVEETRAALALARRADVPEPSPLYWDAMRRSVERRIAEEPRRAPRWAWLGPVAAAAAAVAVFALATGRTHAPSASPAPVLPAWSALPAEEDDPSLVVLEGLAEAEGEMGDLDEGRGVGALLAGLSDDEYQALVESLRGAGPGGES
jgi:anti-sigma factor RsiW